MPVFVGYHVEMGIKKVQFKLCVMPRNREFSEAVRKALFNAKKGTQILFLGVIKFLNTCLLNTYYILETD